MGVLSLEQANERILRAQSGDKQAEEELVAGNLALVKAVVARYAPRGALSFEDLYQLGCIGLIKAIKGFDVSFGVRFSTYAVPMIAGEVRRAIRDDGPMRVSRSLKELAMNAGRAGERLAAQLGREPTVRELAEDLGVEVSELLQALEAQRSVRSLDEPQYDDASQSLGEGIADDQKDLTTRVLLSQLVNGLENQERQVIVMRYYLDLTQSEVAKRMGMSQVQVSRMEARVLKGLRKTAMQ